jgi:hypothetical protein
MSGLANAASAASANNNSNTNQENVLPPTVTLKAAIRAISDAKTQLVTVERALEIATSMPEPNPDVLRTATRLVDTAKKNLNAAYIQLQKMQEGGRRSHRRKRSSHRKTHRKSHHKRKSHRRKTHRRKTHRRKTHRR